jgi:flagellar protein FliS
MVYERLLDHLRSAQLQMSEGTDSSETLTKSVNLITTGLEACLNKAQGGEIAENLAIVYGWANREIMMARLRRDPQMLQGVINAMQPLAEAWREHAGLTNDLIEAANQPMGMAGAEVRSVGSAMAA